MARMRTIKDTVVYYKDIDPETAVNEWWLRQLVKTGKLKCCMAGNKYLINLDNLEEYLQNPTELENDSNTYGKIRKIKS